MQPTPRTRVYIEQVDGPGRVANVSPATKNGSASRPATLRASHSWSPVTPLRQAALPRRAAVEVTPLTWAAGAVAFVVFWSLTYLLRQPGVSDAAARPFSLLGDFALEGAFLALA